MEPHPQNNSSPAAVSPTARGPGRPRKLDEVKRGEICALLSAGCGVRHAAKYVGCSYHTVRREASRNPDFGERLRRAEMYAELSPLRAIQQAGATHWRAAAWMLERLYPDRFAPRDPAALNGRQVRRLMDELLKVVRRVCTDPFQSTKIETHVRATFEHTFRSACESSPTRREFRSAVRQLEDERRQDDPLAQFGFPLPDVASLLRRDKRQPAKPSAKPATEASATASDVLQAVAGRIRTGDEASAKGQAAAESPPPVADFGTPETNTP